MRRHVILLLPVLLLSSQCTRQPAPPPGLDDAAPKWESDRWYTGDKAATKGPPRDGVPTTDLPIVTGHMTGSAGPVTASRPRPSRPASSAASIRLPTEAMPAPALAEPYDAIRGRMATPVDCIEYRRQRAALRGGLAAFRPPEMTVGTPTTLTLAVGAIEQAEAVVTSLGQGAAAVERIDIQIGDSMAAELGGSADLFKISPKKRIVKPMPDNHRQSWKWDVTPLVAGAHSLTLTIGVPAVGASGAGDFYLESKVYPVKVVARPATATGTLDAAAKFLTSLKGVLIALGAVIVAAGGVWLALRNFGRAKPSA